MPTETSLTKDAQRIVNAAEQYATAFGIDGLDAVRLRTAFIAGASFTVDVMRDMHVEVVIRAISK